MLTLFIFIDFLGNNTKYIRHDDSPVLENISMELKQKMRKSKTRGAKSVLTEFLDEREDDELFIAEGILKRDKNKYLVKCVGYEPEWMDSKLIPSFLLEHFQSTGSKQIPHPHIMSSNRTGNIVYNALTWKPESDLPIWNPEEPSLFSGHELEEEPAIEETHDEGPLKCNTKKDKDSRFHRHTAGIFIGIKTSKRHEKSL